MEKEVEVKLEVTEDDFARVRRLLTSRGVPTGIETHHDVYFARPGSFLDEEYPFEWLSVRKRNDTAKFSYKHFYPEREETHTHCDELEVGVASASAAIELLKALGFEERVSVKKTRVTFTYKDTFVSLDRVDDLGTYVEIEAAERADLEKATHNVHSTLLDLDLTRSRRDLRGYPFRMLQKGEKG